MARLSLSEYLAAELRVTLPQGRGSLLQDAHRLARKLAGTSALPMNHLSALAESYERVEQAARDKGGSKPIFECHHAAVQHGKSTLIQAFVLRALRRNPRIKIGYASFSAYRAEKKMAEVRDLAEGEGISIAPGWDTKEEWRTREGGMVVAGGVVGGPWTGQGFDVLIIDDPYKNDEEAESGAHRAKVFDAFERSIWTRRAPWTSIIVNHARWHPNDLIGTLVRKGWAYKCLSAISPSGLPLWPERWPLEELLAIRDGRPAGEDGTGRIDPVSRRTFAALYQGNPQPEDGRIFDPSHLMFYDRLPDGEYQEAAGVDLAYGQKARHDRTAHAFFRRYAASPRKLYLVEPWVGHEGEVLYACRLASVQVRRGGGPTLALPRSEAEVEALWRAQLDRPEVKRARRIPTRWGTSSTEQGTARLMAGYGAVVTPEQARVDLLARVQSSGYQAAWSEGRILYPSAGGQMVDQFRIEHEDFTGSPSDSDDTVAASNSGYELLHVPPVSLLGSGSSVTIGSRPFTSREG